MFFVVQTVAQEHGERKQHGIRVSNAFPSNIGRGTVHGLKQADAVFAQGGGRQEADRAGQLRGFVRKDVTEKVTGDDDIELLRVTHQLHGGVIHE